MDDLIYNRRLETAKELLKLSLDVLKEMIADGYFCTNELELYDKISEFLGIENE